MVSALSYPLENLSDKDCSQQPAVFANEELMAPSSLGGAYECVTELCSTFQYDYFLIATAPGFKEQLKLENIVLTNLPAYLTDELVNMEQSGEWSVLRGIEKTIAPFHWHKEQGLTRLRAAPDRCDSDQNKVSKADRLFVNQLRTATIHCVQAPTRDHQRAFIAAFSPSIDRKTIPSEFVLAFLKIFDRVENLVDNKPTDASCNLTDRELECLRWASVGKTSAEIAVITGLSEHTVNHYLNFCCKKLDCLNRTQAVAKVLRSGIIS